MNFTLLGGVNKAKKLVNNLRQYLTKERMIALSMLSRAFSMVAIVSIIPVGTMQVEAADLQVDYQPVKADIELNVQNSVPDIVKEGDKPEIVVGESNYQKSQREANVANYARETVSREIERTETITSYESDPGFDAKRALAQEAATKYGIDWKILEAVWQVETGKRWDTVTSSYAGAQGPMQFMPGTWSAYGQDGNGDGVADINNARDALYGAANYLAANGAASGDNYSALFAYNHADWYVQKVLGVANSI